MKAFYDIHTEISKFLHPLETSTINQAGDKNIEQLIDEVYQTEPSFLNEVLMNKASMQSLITSADVLDDERKENLIKIRKSLSELISKIKKQLSGSEKKQKVNALSSLVALISQKLNPVKSNAIDFEILVSKLSSLEDVDKELKDACINKFKFYQMNEVVIGLDLYKSNAKCRELASIYRPKNQNEAMKFDSEYRKLLLFCEVANFFEKNGDPQEHALKLAILYGNAKSAIDALKIYGEQVAKKNSSASQYMNLSGQYVHDACLFTLPESIPANWELWKQHLKQNLSDVPYQQIISSADQLESFYSTTINQLKDFKIEVDGKKINEQSSRITAIRKDIKKMQGFDVSELNISLNEELETLAQLHLEQKIKLSEWPKDALMGLFKMYVRTKKPHIQFLASNGLSDSSIYEFECLDRTKAGKNIPELENKALICKSTDGYYFRKLDVSHSLEDAAIGACLGKLTNCCQSMGDAGHGCAVHGLTSPNGGFFVLMKGDGTSPQSTDKVIAQSWVWRGSNNELVFDSVEYNERSIEFETRTGVAGIILNAYDEIINHLVHFSPDIEVVRVGYGATPSSLGVTCGIQAEPADYNGYRDSKSQKMLYHKDIPYLPILKGRSSENDFSKVCKLSTDRLIEELNSYKPGLNSNFIKYLIVFIKEKGGLSEKIQLTEDTRSFLNKLFVPKIFDFDSLNDNSLTKFMEIIKVNNEFLLDLKLGINEWSKEKIQSHFEKGAYFLLQSNDRGNTLLHRLVENSELLSYAISLYPKTDIIQAFGIKYRYTENVLSLACIFPKSLEILLDAYKEYGQLDHFCKDVIDGDVLVKTIENPESFNSILSMFPDKKMLLEALQNNKDKYVDLIGKLLNNPISFKLFMECFSSVESKVNLLRTQFRDGKILLHHVSSKPDLLKIVLQMYPDKNQLIEDICKNDLSFKTPLHYSTIDPNCLKTLIDILPTEKIRQITMSKNKLGNTLLSSALFKLESFKMIYSMLNNNEIEDVLFDNKSSHTTLLHEAINYPLSFKFIFDQLTFEQKNKCLALVNSYGVTVVQYSANQKNTSVLEIILESIPKENRLNAIIEYGIFENWLNNADSLRIILTSLPVNERLNLLMNYQFEDENLFHKCCKRVNLLNIVQGLLSQEDFSKAIKSKSKKNKPSLRFCIDSGCIKLMMSSLSINDRITYLFEKCYDGNTTIECVEYLPENLLEVLDTLNIEQINELMKFQNANGDTLLHRLVSKGRMPLSVLSKHVSNELLFELVQIKNLKNQTFLHCGKLQLSDFKYVLGLYPQERTLQALVDEDIEGKTILSMYSNDWLYLKYALESLPIDERGKCLLYKYSSADPLWNSFYHVLIQHLDWVFQNLTPESLFSVLTANNQYGWSLINHISESSNVVYDKQMYDLVKFKNSKNQTLLHFAKINATHLVYVLNLYPQEKRLQLLKDEDLEGKTILQNYNRRDYVMCSLESLPVEQRHLLLLHKPSSGIPLIFEYKFLIGLDVIFEYISPESRISVLKEKDNLGNSVYIYLLGNVQMIDKVLKSIPDVDLPEALKFIEFECTQRYLEIPDEVSRLMKEHAERLVLIKEKPLVLFSLNNYKATPENSNKNETQSGDNKVIPPKPQ